nr:MAG: ORF1 [TTV-like mini virus]
MPAYWKTYRRWRRPFKRYRRRSWFSRRRIRKPFQRRYYTRRRRYRRFKVKRTKNLKKKVLKLKQWNPETIRKCKIVGYKCLLQGSILRAQHNYVQYLYSYVPENFPGGGGWSIMVFSLGSLYEDYDHLQNIWTSSNAALPLVRYTGCTIKLFQSEETDYAFIYDRCWPMVDTPDTHADSSPSRMTQRYHKIVVPSRKTKYRKKPYKKIKIRPPTQFQNKWYFQKDICNTPLLMTTTTAISLTNPFANSNSLSNNLVFLCLNPFLFSNPHFQHFPETTGYSHKILNGKSMYLYANHQQRPNNDTQLTEWLKSLIFLGNTTTNQPGREYQDYYQNGNNSKINWGNPFYHRYLETTSDTSYTIFTSSVTTLEIVSQLKGITQSNVKVTNFQEITGPIIYKVTYNPTKDTGLNKAYLINTSQQITLDEPENKNLIIEGYPLYNMLWGWTDFIKKLKDITNVDTNALLVIKTKVFDDQTLPVYIPIDKDFIEGLDPYQTHEQDVYQQNYYNKLNWFPRILYQEQTINNLCLTGPKCPRNVKYLQAECKYTFYFKWGGCPKKLEKAYDPCSQPKWPTPDNLQRGLTIENPNQPPETQLYSWDWKKDYVTKEAIERIREYTITDETIFSPTETKSSAPPTRLQTQETLNKEEEKRFIKQLQQLRKLQLHLELKCRQQLKK